MDDATKERDRALARWQAITGIAFATFLVPHLVNTMCALGGPGAYDGVQHVLEVAYQFLPIETLLITAGTVHFVIGLVRIRRGRPRATSLRTRAHRIAGYVLVAFFLGHAVATRGPSLTGLGPHLGFAGLTYSLARLPAFFFPYYVVFAIAGVVHVVQGLLVAAGVLRAKVPAALTRPRLVVGVAVVGGALVTLAVLAMGGLFFPIHDPMDNDFARFGEATIEGLLP